MRPPPRKGAAALRPADGNAARVSGTHARWAAPDGERGWLAAGPVALLMLAAACGTLLAGLRFVEPDEGWPCPPRPARTGAAEVGNRAIKRRRRRKTRKSP